MTSGREKPGAKPGVGASNSTTVNPSDRRRSQRVVLRVSVLLKADMPDGKPVEAQGFTLVVNAHGGLLESPLAVTANQKITLVNPQTHKEVACRVVRVKQGTSGLVTMAFEFDAPAAQFWPVSFPPEDWQEAAP
jgi:hypothetical protein